jgi:hypothetical protein
MPERQRIVSVTKVRRNSAVNTIVCLARHLHATCDVCAGSYRTAHRSIRRRHEPLRAQLPTLDDQLSTLARGHVYDDHIPD